MSGATTKQRTIVAALVACLALPSCGSCETEGPYKVTLYSGGEVVREWDGVSDYTRFDRQCMEIHVDGESFVLCGDGPIVIEQFDWSES